MVAEWKSNRSQEMWDSQKNFFHLQRATRALPANPDYKQISVQL